ncbi:hypothetical protein ASPWEDRAFT_183849 [Aspergillus wentii DTO 134E9]|uniref:MYND-type domain-containing protein n=1 Tax=Aspergillus wentii DTO 134E9 TaxID=1073089 RepID=A0A1L9RLP5_ASPWE|nr:uncharacterized protein ASPWEDRAFT_183849 [Aspergillus wentii DTO 134E9]OJJ35841.1 hypothetical protein ASPWEDRAFT_183849 [Aspergillus wentii DTO 134E9]
MENPSSAPSICAHCQNSTTKKCSGCSDAPRYDKETPQPTFYCSRVCQKSDWDRHKTNCKRLQTRKTLSRAASFLQAIFYRIRLHAYPLQFTTVRAVGSTVYLEGYKGEVSRLQRQLTPFSADVKGGQDILDAALVYIGCSEAMVYLYAFVAALLMDISFTVEEIQFEATNNKLSIKTCFANGGDQFGHFPGHNVYRITLLNGEVWAIDPSGAQYGYHGALYPWSELAAHRVGKAKHEFHFGYFRDTFRLQYGLFRRTQNDVSELTEQLDLAMAIEGKIDVLVKPYAGKLKTILKGSDAAFGKAKAEFLGRLEAVIVTSLDEIYQPERIVRRTKEVQRRLHLIEQGVGVSCIGIEDMMILAF